MSANSRRDGAASDPAARTKLMVAAVLGVVVGAVAAVAGAGRSAPLVGWDAWP